MISIIDYGVGNLGSISNMINYIGGQSKIINSPSEINESTKLILPGVGRYDYGISKLKESNFIESLNTKVLNDKVPILGICLGAQLMCKKSEEGFVDGLGWLDAEVKKFKINDELRVPHMGWNYVKSKKSTKISNLGQEDERFYFVHSYYMSPNCDDDIMFETNYGGFFASGLNKNNIYACQFHPEKSHKYGISLMKRFLEI